MSEQMLSILVFCYGYQRRYGYAPTQQEIADALLRKQASVARSIKRLAHLGYVERGVGWRNVRVLRLPGRAA
jgi:DNA-binding MarR family transcriptional regulator